MRVKKFALLVLLGSMFVAGWLKRKSSISKCASRA